MPNLVKWVWVTLPSCYVWVVICVTLVIHEFQSMVASYVWHTKLKFAAYHIIPEILIICRHITSRCSGCHFNISFSFTLFVQCFTSTIILRRCISLEPTIHFGSTQTHCGTRVKPFFHLHINIILLLHGTSFEIKHPIGGTVHHLPSTIQLTGAILIVFKMNLWFIYCLVCNCIVFYMHACFVLSPAKKNGFNLLCGVKNIYLSMTKRFHKSFQALPCLCFMKIKHLALGLDGNIALGFASYYITISAACLLHSTCGNVLT